MARSVQLHASHHSSGRSRRERQPSLKPGAYRPPLRVTAAAARAPFQPPRRVGSLSQPMPAASATEQQPVAGSNGETAAAAGPRGLGSRMYPPSAAQRLLAHPVVSSSSQPAVAPRGLGLSRAYTAAGQAHADSSGPGSEGLAAIDGPVDVPVDHAHSAEGQLGNAAQTSSQQPVLLSMRARRWPVQPDNGRALQSVLAPAAESASLENNGAALRSAQYQIGVQRSRRESREWVMRVAEETQAFQEAIAGTTSSSSSEEQGSPGLHSGGQGAGQHESAQPTHPGVSAAEDEPDAARRQSREWVRAVALQSAEFREAAAVLSSLEQDIAPSGTLPAPAVQPSSDPQRGKRLDVEVSGHTNAAGAAEGLQPSGSLLIAGVSQGEKDSEEGMCGSPCQKGHAAADELMPDASEDGPLAAWYELQNECAVPMVPSTSNTDASVDIVGLGSPGVSSMAVQAAAAKRDLVALPDQDAAIEAAKLGEQPPDQHSPSRPVASAEVSDDRDIFIDISSQSQDCQPSASSHRASARRAVKHTSSAQQEAKAGTGGQQVALAELGAEPRETSEAGFSPCVELCLHLSLPSSGQADVSPSQKSQEGPPPPMVTDADDHTPPESLWSDRGAELRDRGIGAENRGMAGPADDRPREEVIFRPRQGPPTEAELQASMLELGLTAVVHQPVFYGNPADVPNRPTGCIIRSCLCFLSS